MFEYNHNKKYKLFCLINFMNIQYECKSNGDLLIRDPATEKTVILHDAYWAIEGRIRCFGIPHYNAPIVDAPREFLKDYIQDQKMA